MQDTGFFHVNAGNQWQLAQFFRLAANADGAIVLMAQPAPAAGLFERGAFLFGPFQVFATKTPWYRLRAFADPLAPGTHVRFFTYASEGALPSGFNLSDDDPFGDPVWVKQPRDSLDVLIRAPSPTGQGLRIETRNLWIGGL